MQEPMLFDAALSFSIMFRQTDELWEMNRVLERMSSVVL